MKKRSLSHGSTGCHLTVYRVCAAVLVGFHFFLQLCWATAAAGHNPTLNLYKVSHLRIDIENNSELDVRKAREVLKRAKILEAAHLAAGARWMRVTDGKTLVLKRFD